MKVLFSPAYQLELDPKQASNLEPYPPLGTLYAAARLRQGGHDVRLSDSMLASGHGEFEADLESFRPDLVAIYEDDFNYLSKMCLTNMREAARAKARLARAKGALVAVHGSDATDHLSSYLETPMDFAILGEGEQTLFELASALSSGRGDEVQRIAGLAFVDRDGGVVKTSARGFLRNLDDLPFPAWDLVDVERYRRAWRARHTRFSINMVTTRGCPYRCNWCAKPIYGQRYNVRSPASVAEELTWLKATVEPDHVWFADDIFGLKPGWVEAFSEEVESRGCETPYKIQARVDLIDVGVARALRRSGCESVWVGAESGSQRILDAMDKGTTVEQIFDATRLLKAEGIAVGFFLQFGYPGEGWSDIARTRSLVRGAAPDEIGISVSYPLPGTPFFERVRAELAVKTNWAHSDDLDLMFVGTYPPEFYRALYRLVHSEFRLRRELGSPLHPMRLARYLANLARWTEARIAVSNWSRKANPDVRSQRSTVEGGFEAQPR